MPSIGVEIALMFLGGQSLGAFFKEYLNPESLSNDELNEVINALIEKQIIVEKSNSSHRFSQELLSEWYFYNWFESADHHLHTFDISYLNYIDEPELEVDIMSNYRSESIEPSRTKKYDNSDFQIEIDSCKDLINNLPDSKEEEEVLKSGLCERTLSKLISITFGKFRERKLRNFPNVEPLIRKTSPSGGSLHPTECYLINLEKHGIIEEGTYHFSVLTNTLDKICEKPSDALVKKLFDGLLRFSKHYKAIIVYTSLFERNMFRYREPRTFRTILIDVGHLVGTLEFLCEKFGIQSFSHHGNDDFNIEEFLGLDPLSEGVIYCTGLL